MNKRKEGKTNEAPAINEGTVQAYLLHPKWLKLDHGEGLSLHSVEDVDEVSLVGMIKGSKSQTPFPKHDGIRHGHMFHA